MKASQLIKILQACFNVHGDITVFMRGWEPGDCFLELKYCLDVDASNPPVIAWMYTEPKEKT